MRVPGSKVRVCVMPVSFQVQWERYPQMTPYTIDEVIVGKIGRSKHR